MKLPSNRQPVDVSTPKRIAFVLTSSQSLSLMKGVVRALQEHGWEVSIACNHTGPQEPVEGFHLHHVEMSRGITPIRDCLSFFTLLSLLRSIAPDVIVGATPKGALLSMTAGKVLRVRHRVYWLWGARWEDMVGLKKRMVRELDRLTMRCSTDVLSVSQSLAETYLTNGLCRRLPTIATTGGTKGVSLAEFYPQDPKQATSTQVLFVGRISRSKGIRDFVNVAELVKKESPDVDFMLVGGLDEADPVDAETLMKIHHADVVRWVNESDRVGDYMRSATLLLFPSYREGLPNALMEAAACGLPVVAYDATGVRDAVVDGQSGILVPLGDVTALAAATMQLLNDGRLRRSMSIDAVAIARELFSSEKVEVDLCEYINSLESADEI